MPASPAPKRPASVQPKYWDRRHPTEYHTDPDCRVGRWIPSASRYESSTHAGRRCESCAEDRRDYVPLLFAI